jgi:dipeptidyl-peptidase-4
LNGKRKKKISTYRGINNPAFSTGMNFFVNKNRSATTPLKVTLHKADGTCIKVLEKNDRLLKTFKNYQLTTKEFFSFVTGDSVRLNGYMLKPAHFDPSKKYPVLMNVYGGPGSQTVRNTWERQYWHNYLTQQGYIIVSVDNRGTGGRGVAFKHCTYKQLGNLEVRDQIEAARYLRTLP